MSEERSPGRGSVSERTQQSERSEQPDRTQQDPVLGLLDDLLRLAEGSPAGAIEVEADGFSVAITRDPRRSAASAPRTRGAGAVARTEDVQRVHATAVGIFSLARPWTAGDRVERGAVLGGIQSLGHIAEITAPVDGVIREVLVASGAPVEYGQTLFAIALR
jgi:acetyl-CoA carboxylase biotin carboxyl carrier protein